VVWLTAVSQNFQIARVANFQLRFHSIVASQWDCNPGFTVHADAAAHTFRAATKFCSMLLREQLWFFGNYLSFDGLANFMLTWIWCGSQGSWDDFYLWNVINAQHFCKILITNGNSIACVSNIVNIYVNNACFLY